jgi:hypothetical protein
MLATAGCEVKLLPAIVRALAPGGVLIYETCAHGNERFGRARNPDFPASPGELLEAFTTRRLRTERHFDTTPRRDPAPGRHIRSDGSIAGGS